MPRLLRRRSGRALRQPMLRPSGALEHQLLKLPQLLKLLRLLKLQRPLPQLEQLRQQCCCRWLLPWLPLQMRLAPRDLLRGLLGAALPGC